MTFRCWFRWLVKGSFEVIVTLPERVDFCVNGITEVSDKNKANIICNNLKRRTDVCVHYAISQVFFVIFCERSQNAE